MSKHHQMKTITAMFSDDREDKRKVASQTHPNEVKLLLTPQNEVTARPARLLRSWVFPAELGQHVKTTACARAQDGADQAIQDRVCVWWGRCWPGACGAGGWLEQTPCQVQRKKIKINKK